MLQQGPIYPLRDVYQPKARKLLWVGHTNTNEQPNHPTNHGHPTHNLKPGAGGGDVSYFSPIWEFICMCSNMFCS